MKLNVLLTILIIFSKFTIAQELVIDESGKYFNQQIISINEKDTEKLFDKTMEWIAINYKSAQDVIQYSDKESGKIICKGNFSVNLFMKDGWISHTLSLEIK